jgi:hypothetical protein
MRVRKKPPDLQSGGFFYFFQVCLSFSVTILTGPTTRGLSFTRRRTIIRTMTMSKTCTTFMFGFLSVFPTLDLPQIGEGWEGVTKKPPVGWAACVSLSRCGYFTLTAAIPTVIWSLRIRTEIITIRTREVKIVCMICFRYFADYRLF